MRVPNPPTMHQMMISADWPRLNSRGVTISAQLANSAPASPAIAAPMVNSTVLRACTS